MNRKKCRAFGAIWAISQGLLSALLPKLSIKMVKKMIGKNFENADALEAKPEYKKTAPCDRNRNGRRRCRQSRHGSRR